MKNIPFIKVMPLLLSLLFVAACGGVKKEEKAKKQADQAKKSPDTVYVERAVEKTTEVPQKDTTTALAPKEVEQIKLDNNLVKEEFYVIGGSFKELKRAQGLEKALKKKGYQAQVLKPHKGFNRVAVRAFAEEKKARKELDALRKIFNDVSFWLLMPS